MRFRHRRRFGRARFGRRRSFGRHRFGMRRRRRFGGRRLRIGFRM